MPMFDEQRPTKGPAATVGAHPGDVLWCPRDGWQWRATAVEDAQESA